MRDPPRDMLTVLFIGALIGVSFWILRPFLGAIVWATTIVVATWPAMLAVQARLWGKRALAVTVMTLALVVVLILPFMAVIGTIVANVDPIVNWAHSLATDTLPSTPAWLRQIPLVGEQAARAWEQIAAKGIQGLAAKAAPHVASIHMEIAKVIPMAALIERAPIVYNKEWNYGRLVARGSKHRGVFLHYDWYPTPAFCATFHGVYEGVLRYRKLAGTVTKTRCVRRGDDHCEYVMEWS